MDSLNINKTLVNLLGEQCVTCSGNFTTEDMKPNQDPQKLVYILLLISGFAFLTFVVMYWRFSKSDHSADPYHQYIIGTWKEWKEDSLILVNHRERSASLTFVNQTVIDGHLRPEPGPSSM